MVSQPPVARHNPTDQNTGVNPTVAPSAPNASGTAQAIDCTSDIRTPAASPVRPGGAWLCSSDMTIGWLMPSPRPSANDIAISAVAVWTNGNTMYTVPATNSATVSTWCGVAWRTIQRSHAIANGVYVAAVNRIGHEDEPGTDGLTFFGRSFIADPFGRYVAEAGADETILIARCDPALIENVRRNWPFLRDRRIDAYGPILQRYLAR